MRENLMSPAHKAVSEEYRKNYDRIQWDKEEKDEHPCDARSA
jgi:hypothetical protein